jgi:hypothetical protein
LPRLGEPQADPADHRAEPRGHEDHEGQHLPAGPRADRGEELEVAEAHAFLAREQAKGPVHRPETMYPAPRRTPPSAGPRRCRMRYREAQPQQRQRDVVGQELRVEVDEGERDHAAQV